MILLSPELLCSTNENLRPTSDHTRLQHTSSAGAGQTIGASLDYDYTHLGQLL